MGHPTLVQPRGRSVRIVIEGIRGEITITTLCGREGIATNVYYKWLKDLSAALRTGLGWKVQPSMSSPDIVEIVQQAAEFTGKPTVPVDPGPALLTDNGPGFLGKALEISLGLRAMKHITASPYHTRTNGKLERYHRTAKARVNLLVYYSLGELSEAMASFVDYYTISGIMRSWGT